MNMENTLKNSKYEHELANLRVANLHSNTQELHRELANAVNQGTWKSMKQASQELSGIYSKIAEIAETQTNPKGKQ